MKILVGNLVTEYLDEGQGNIVLFLHGWQDNLHSFDRLAGSLSDKNRVVRLDLPGFGTTETPQNGWNLNSYVDFVAEFVEKLNLSVNTIVGHSFGGRIIIKGISNEKLKAEKIILIDSAGVANRRTFRNVFFYVVAKIGKFITYIPPLYFGRQKLRNLMYKKVGRDYSNAGVLQQIFINVIKEDLSNDARKIKLPTLLIWGENDTETSISQGKKLNEFITGSQFKIIKNAGHFAHKEKTVEVVEIIKKFLC